MSIARTLLAEKLIDDFYDESPRYDGRELSHESSLMERLKALLPAEHHDLFFRWEAECAENGGHELRQFADFVAGILMSNHHHGEGDGE